MAKQITNTYHKSSYPAISPSRPELSQAGKTVLVTGGHTGIGYAIATAFITASVARVIIIGRRPEVVHASVLKLIEETEHVASDTVVLGKVCDISNLDSTAALWSDLSCGGIFVDILVLSAATLGTTESILARGFDQVWGDCITNIRSILDFAERLHGQPREDARNRKVLLNVSSAAIHTWLGRAGARATYGLTKNAGTLLLQQIAKDTPPQEMQIISFHPGTILSEAALGQGFSENSGVPWDEITLPASFAVWAASAEADFLHGRFVWANWDVDELRSGDLQARIEEDANFLKIGVIGLE